MNDSARYSYSSLFSIATNYNLEYFSKGCFAKQSPLQSLQFNFKYDNHWQKCEEEPGQWNIGQKMKLRATRLDSTSKLIKVSVCISVAKQRCFALFLII